jgi:hypothetical protein
MGVRIKFDGWSRQYKSFFTFSMYDRADAYSDIQAGFIGNGEATSYFSHLIAVLSTQGGVG